MSDEIKTANVTETPEAAPTVYNYNRKTGEFTGTETANPNPREGGWLLPGHATFTAPPEKGEKQAQRYNTETDEWELVPDHRGEKWYNKQTQEEKEIKEIGEEPDETLYTQAKPDDGAAKWDEESQSWKVPQEVLDERELQTAQAQAQNIIDTRSRMAMVQTANFTAAEFQTLAKARYFEEWQAGQTYEAGYRIQYEGVVYEVIQDVTAQAHQTPATEGMLAIYRPLSLDEGGEEHEGTLDDPIPWIYGMDTEKDKYYSYNGNIYRCVQAQKPSVWEPGAAGTAAIWEFVQAEA